MTLKARDYAWKVRDSAWERELAAELRKGTEAERLAFLQELAVANLMVAMDLAKRCLTKPKSFEVLLEQALNEADSSSIRYWLDCIVPRLGFRKVVARLHQLSLAKCEAVAKAVYWLPSFSQLPGYSWKDVESLQLA